MSNVTVRDSNDPKRNPRPTVRQDQGPISSIALPESVNVNPDIDIKEEKQGLIKIIKPKASDDWLKKLYNPTLISINELSNIYNALRYAGFDRDIMLAKIEQKCDDPKIAIELIIGCALRGPQAMSRLKMSNGKTPLEMGIPGSGKMGTEDLSCQRVTAATADLAAYYLKLIDIPKRILSMECPGWLQFPSAGSIKLPENLRKMHIDFSRRFSEVIGGTFREEIYSQMMGNAYLNDNLKLFEDNAR